MTRLRQSPSAGRSPRPPWPLPVTRTAAILTIDSTKVDSVKLAALELVLYGTVGVDPLLPTPDAVIAALTTTLTAVSMGLPANQPTYVAGTHIVTLPVVTGVTWKINGVTKSTGAQPALTVGTECQRDGTRLHRLPSHGRYRLDVRLLNRFTDRRPESAYYYQFQESNFRMRS